MFPQILFILWVVMMLLYAIAAIGLAIEFDRRLNLWRLALCCVAWPFTIGDGPRYWLQEPSQ